jgi:hypothetical protein
VDGPKPIFFSGWGENVRYEQFLFGEPDARTEFGAEQGILHNSNTELRLTNSLLVILVRNNGARDHLRRQIGEGVGLILCACPHVYLLAMSFLIINLLHRTLYESKGLEFSDVS